MKFERNQFWPHIVPTLAQPVRGRRLHRILMVLLLGAAAMLTAQQSQPTGQQPASGTTTTAQEPTASRIWTVSPPVVIPDTKDSPKNFDAANDERRRQIAEDSGKLLKMATDLKAEVDKTTKDTLSLSVIRKADEIEKLAHNVKEKMKLTTEPK
jgi:hypothetical protein